MTKDRPILFICDKAPSNGAPHQHMAAIWLNHAGFNVRTLCSGRGGERGAGEYRTPLGAVKASYLGPLDWQQGAWVKLKWHLRYFLEILGERLRSAPDTLYYVQGHVSCPAAWLALMGVPRRRQVYHTQDYLEPGRHSVWAFFERRYARRAGTVLCNEINRGRFMASNYGLDAQPVTIPTTLPTAWIRSKPRQAGRARRLGKLGLPTDENLRLVLHQGPYLDEVRCGRSILDAMQLLPKRYILAFTGNQAGAWLDAAKRDVAARPGLTQRVHFIGQVPFDELLKVTELFDLGLLLYPNDGVGNFYQAPGRLTEYIGCGLPVVTSRFPGLELLVMKRGLGQVADPTSAEDIARAILALGQRDRRAIDEGRLQLRRTFEKELCYEASAALLERTVLSAGAGPRP